MKHEERTRVQSIAGKSSNQTQNPDRAMAFRKQSGLVKVMLNREVKKAEGVDKARFQDLRSLALQMSILISIAGEMPMGSSLPAGSAGSVAKAKTAAHGELMMACHEAGDLMYMMGLTLEGYLEVIPTEGLGMKGLAANAASRLMECFDAANEVNDRNGGAR
jgi:hypothetical protein